MASPIDPTQAIAQAFDAFSAPSNAEEPQPTPLDEIAKEDEAEETPLERAASQNNILEVNSGAQQGSLVGSTGNMVQTAPSLEGEGDAATPQPGSYVEVLA